MDISNEAGGRISEMARLRLHAATWESETEILLDKLPFEGGWTCIDLGCGPTGILEPMSRRTGASGKVIGVDTNEEFLSGANAFMVRHELKNVRLIHGAIESLDLPVASFDLVHER